MKEKSFETLKEAKKHQKENHPNANIYDLKKLHPNRKKRYFVGTHLQWLNH